MSNIMEPSIEQTSKTVEYWGILNDIAIFGGIGFMTCLLTSMKMLKNSYKSHNALQIIGNIIFTSCGAMAMAAATSLMVSEVYPGISSEGKFAVAMCIGIFGQKLFDVFLVKRFGLTTTDLQDESDIDHIKRHLAAQEDGHATSPDRKCPFHEGMQCAECLEENCPGKKQ